MITFGTAVKVLVGFYLGCTGYVDREMTVPSLSGHPAYLNYEIVLEHCPKIENVYGKMWMPSEQFEVTK